jgi:diacylglycerol O-acyltransferase/trehalose O-mycolyltransferase
LGDTGIPGQVLESITLDSNKNFQTQYVGAGGKNGTFNFPPTGIHDWAYWNSQLVAMKGDIQRTLGA